MDTEHLVPGEKYLPTWTHAPKQVEFIEQVNSLYKFEGDERDFALYKNEVAMFIHPLKEAKEEDQIKSPSHYVSHPSGIEPIQITKYESFLRGNVIKYVMRAPYKGNELQDIKKALQYLQWELERLESDQQPKADNGGREG